MEKKSKEMLNEKIFTEKCSCARQIRTEDIVFAPSLLELCKMNTCGNYGKSYTCPPHVGEVDVLIEELKSYPNAIVFQKVYPLEDSFDVEGMEAGNRDFRLLSEEIDDVCRRRFKCYKLLSAGGCRKCPVCGAVDKTPCPYPDKAFASLESYGIEVSSLAKLCGMNYINGQNTVTYFGAVFYK